MACAKPRGSREKVIQEPTMQTCGPGARGALGGARGRGDQRIRAARGLGVIPGAMGNPDNVCGMGQHRRQDH